VSACDDCLRRADLIGAVAGRLQVEFKRRTAPGRVLALGDEELLAVAGSRDARRRYARFDVAAARRRAAAAGLATVCACDDAYPPRLRDLADPPAVLHVLGDSGAPAVHDGVAVVGARQASSYGLEVARALGRGLSVAGVPVISGLALGIDSAAHAGALDGRAPARAHDPRGATPASGRRGATIVDGRRGATIVGSRRGPTIGVLAGSAHLAYPARGWRLHAAVAEHGAVVSELPPGASAHRWCFVARNRIIAALSAVTVVVQATGRSGSLTTADFAAELGRTVAAVPGLVTSRLSAGTHLLIQAGAPLVRDAADVLELLADATGEVFEPAPAAPRVDLHPALAALLAAVEDGRGTLGELASTPDEARTALAGLAELERLGLVRRGFAGRWERAA
jgi:DNA processing protein